MHYLIYQLKNKINNKIYIGYHKTKDIDDGYMGSGKYIKSAVAKYGVENFEKTIIKFCSSEAEMKRIETEIVNEDFVKREDTYNLKVGGHGGFRKGFVSLNGKQVTSDEFKKNPTYHGVCKGKVSAFDKKGSRYQVKTDDNRLVSGELTRCFEKNGLVSVLDQNGKQIRITSDEFKTGKYASIYKGLVSVRDKDGKVFKVEKFDNRYVNGELVGVTKGINFTESGYQIFDMKGVMKYEIKNENFIVFCKKNNLPYGVLKKSYLNGGCKIYEKLGSNRKRLEKNGLLKYRGWYCIKIK